MKNNSILCIFLIILLMIAVNSVSAQDTPKQGGNITIAISQDLDQSLDPHTATSAGKRERKAIAIHPVFLELSERVVGNIPVRNTAAADNR